MTFTVTYRAKSGSIAKEIIEAKDRADALASCRARGVTPLSIASGNTSNTISSVKPRSITRGILASAAVVVSVACVYFLFLSKTPLTPQPVPVERKSVFKPVVKKPFKPTVTNTTTHVARLKRHRKPKMVPVVTESIRPPDLPLVDNVPKYGEINGSNIWPRALFKTREENLIAGILTAKPGSRVLVNHFMPGEEARFLAALNVPIESDENDTPAEAEMRKLMADVKEELKAAVAKGEKITDIIQEARNQLNEQANYRQKLLQTHSMLMKEGTPEEAEQYRTEANKMLAEYGMDPLPLRSTQRARYEQYMDEKKATQGQQ